MHTISDYAPRLSSPENIIALQSLGFIISLLWGFWGFGMVGERLENGDEINNPTALTLLLSWGCMAAAGYLCYELLDIVYLSAPLRGW